MSYPTITCPTGCLNDVPVISMDECNPLVDFSEVDKLYLTALNNPLADWTDAAEWVTRIDNTGVAVDDIRELWVSGELPEPERATTEIDNERDVWSPMKFTMPLEVFETNLINYDFMRILQCGGLFLAWFSAGENMYGGTDGIEVNIKASFLITKGAKELNKIMLEVGWDAKHNPERITNPLI